MKNDPYDPFFEDQLKYRSYTGGDWCLMSSENVCGTADSRTDDSYCHDCMERFAARQGASIPKELLGTYFDDFIRWKTFQFIEYNRLNGRYTDEQAKIARKHYTDFLLKSLGNNKQQTGAKEHRDILNKLFNS